MSNTKALLKNLFAFSLLGLLFVIVDWRQLISALSELTLVSIVNLLVVSLLLVVISTLKWKLFLKELGGDVPLWRLFKLYLVGYFVNLIVPSYIGGDVVRSFYAGKQAGQHEAATATILERYTGLVAMITIALAFVWFVDIVTFEIKVAVVLCSLGLAAITALALWAERMRFVSNVIKQASISNHLGKVQAGLSLARQNRPLLLKTLGLSYLFHTFTILNTLIAAYAVGWNDAPVLDLFVVVPLILLIGSLPVSPAGLGIQEGAFFFFLTGIGALPGQALGVAIVLRAKGYLLAMLGGLIWLKVRREVEDAPAVLQRASEGPGA